MPRGGQTFPPSPPSEPPGAAVAPAAAAPNPGVHVARSVNPTPALNARWPLLPVSGSHPGSQLTGSFGSILSGKDLQKGSP